jgi:hypothetical protein
LALAVILVPALVVETMSVREIEIVVERIKPLLSGRPPETQGAILADLLAIWLAGHHIAGDVEATRTLRADILAAHLQLLPQLVEINARILGTTP